MIELVGAALVGALLEGARTLAPALRRTGRHLLDVTTPPPGMRLQTADGGQYNGLVVVEKNLPVLVLVTRTETRDRHDGVTDEDAPHGGAYLEGGPPDATSRPEVSFGAGVACE